MFVHVALNQVRFGTLLYCTKNNFKAISLKGFAVHKTLAVL